MLHCNQPAKQVPQRPVAVERLCCVIDALEAKSWIKKNTAGLRSQALRWEEPVPEGNLAVELLNYLTYGLMSLSIFEYCLWSFPPPPAWSSSLQLSLVLPHGKALVFWQPNPRSPKQTLIRPKPHSLQHQSHLGSWASSLRTASLKGAHASSGSFLRQGPGPPHAQNPHERIALPTHLGLQHHLIAIWESPAAQPDHLEPKNRTATLKL